MTESLRMPDRAPARAPPASRPAPAGQQAVLNGVPALSVPLSNAETGQLDLTLEGHQAIPWQGAWSPAGDWIAYVSQEAGNDDIFRVNPQGAEKQRLTLGGLTTGRDAALVLLLEDVLFDLLIDEVEGETLFEINRPECLQMWRT